MLGPRCLQVALLHWLKGMKLLEQLADIACTCLEGSKPFRAVDDPLQFAIIYVVKGGRIREIHCNWTPSYVCQFGRIVLCLKPCRCNGHHVSVLLAVSKKERAWE